MPTLSMPQFPRKRLPEIAAHPRKPAEEDSLRLDNHLRARQLMHEKNYFIFTFRNF